MRYNGALAMDASIIPAYLTLAEYYDRKTPSEPVVALDYLRKAFSQDRQHSGLIASLVRQLVKTGNAGEAESLVVRQLSQNKNDVASLQLAGAYYGSQQDYAKASQYYEAILRQEATNYEAAVRLAELSQLAQKPFTEVLGAYTRAIDIAPERAFAYTRLLYAAAQSDQTRVAEQQIAALSKQHQTGTGSAVLAAFFASQQQIDKAERYLTQTGNSQIEQKLLDDVRLRVYYAKAVETALCQ